MKITLPDDWHEITLEQYKEVWKVYERETESYAAVRRSIEVLAGLKPGQLEHVQWADLTKATDKINWFLSEPDARTMQMPLQNIITHNNKQYGFIPDWGTLTVGEFADIETYMQESSFTNLEHIMSILYRPIALIRNDCYEIELYKPDKQRAKDMLTLPMDVVMGAFVFFCNIEKALATTTQQYLAKQGQGKSKKA
jgi:hypothetical protein